MGIYLTYDEQEQKWKWSGFMFEMYFDTKEEAEANRNKVWERHIKNVNAFSITNDMLVSLRG